MAHDLTTVLQAAQAAARWHARQRRKGASSDPYINHLLEVATLVAKATGGTDTGLVIAALLHDAIEDHDIPRAEIAGAFGEDVARLVEEVTDPAELDEPTRRRHQVEHARHLSPRAKILKLADKTSNLRDLAAAPPPDWPAQRMRDYVQWGRDVVAALGPVNAWLEREFEAVAGAALSAAAGRNSIEAR